jgi:glycosyltransferase involved in cell wall biosynthesis
MNYFFSVVIPLYNKANYIQSCLESVLKQTHKEFEVILVNDGSTDGSEAVVERFQDSRIRLVHQENKGASAARNKGVSLAKHEWIALIDADDYWYPNHLEELQNTIEQFPKADVVCNNYEILLDNDFIKQPAFSIEYPLKAQYIEDYFKGSLIDPIAWTSALSFTSSIFKKVGEFDTNIKSGQDIDLMVKFGLTATIAFNPKTSSRYIINSENNLAKTNYFPDRLYFISKYKREENKNSSLKAYLDINRYALVIRCKLASIPLWKEIIHEINPENLNYKQKILLRLPAKILISIKRFQNYLIDKGLYITPFR